MKTGAEETLLCYLFREPDMLERIAAQVKPEHFRDDLNRRIYAFYSECIRAGVPEFSLTLFEGEEFSPQERGYVQGILHSFDGQPLSGGEIEECIYKMTHPEVPVQNAGDMGDDEFRSLMRQISNK